MKNHVSFTTTRGLQTMTSFQKTIVKAWICGGIFMLAMMLTLLLPAKDEHLAHFFLGALFVLLLMLNPDLRAWKGYGANGMPLGEFLQKHRFLQVWLVCFCAFVLPFLMYWIYESADFDWKPLALFFVLLMGPVGVVSEVERYRSAGE